MWSLLAFYYGRDKIKSRDFSTEDESDVSKPAKSFLAKSTANENESRYAYLKDMRCQSALFYDLTQDIVYL